MIALEICEQLAKFHSWESAVVHGDIKPSNIHLGRDDTVRLLDFGIAKTLRADCNATDHNFGSPGYCSPERLTRNEVDPQSDLWAVGATLYEMLAGAPPYQAENTRKLEGLIRSKRPPRALPASCPRGLRASWGRRWRPKRGSATNRRSNSRRTCNCFWSASRRWRRWNGGRLESDSHPGSGAPGTSPRNADCAAQAQPSLADTYRGGVLCHRNAALDWRHTRLGRYGKREPARRRAPLR